MNPEAYLIMTEQDGAAHRSTRWDVTLSGLRNRCARVISVNIYAILRTRRCVFCSC